MFPPYPMQFTLWGPAVWAELTAGLWRALATPWLEPLRPAPDGSPAGATVAAPRSAACARIARAAVVGEPVSPEPAMGRFIEVPPARWRDRRARSVSSAADR